MQTKLYRQQHGEILRHLDQLDKMTPSEPEQEICLEMGRLAGIVKLHLALEDKNVYPRMFAHADPLVQSTAREYQETMGDLATAYVSFHEKWIRTGAIGASRMQFIKEFHTVRDALRQRITRENQGLYAMLDEREIAVAS